MLIYIYSSVLSYHTRGGFVSYHACLSSCVWCLFYCCWIARVTPSSHAFSYIDRYILTYPTCLPSPLSPLPGRSQVILLHLGQPAIHSIPCWKNLPPHFRDPQNPHHRQRKYMNQPKRCSLMTKNKLFSYLGVQLRHCGGRHPVRRRLYLPPRSSLRPRGHPLRVAPYSTVSFFPPP